MVKCDICGHECDKMQMMVTRVHKSFNGDEGEHERFVKMFGKNELNSCFCCLAINNGFIPITERG